MSLPSACVEIKSKSQASRSARLQKSCLLLSHVPPWTGLGKGAGLRGCGWSLPVQLKLAILDPLSHPPARTLLDTVLQPHSAVTTTRRVATVILTLCLGKQSLKKVK